MPLLTITNLRTSPVSIQDPTGLYGTSLLVPGSGSVTNVELSLMALAALEPQLVAQATASNITWSTEDDPSTLADDVPLNVVTGLVTPIAAAADAQVIVTKLTSPGAVSVVLPAAAAIGREVYVVDGTGDAGTNNVTVTATGGTINGGASVVINTNYGSVLLYKTATNVWLAIGTAAISSGAAGGDLVGTYPNPTLAATFISAPQALSGAGAVNLTTRTTLFTSTGSAQALSLANASRTGQRKTLFHTVDGGSGVLTPTTAGNFATATVSVVKDWVEFEWSGSAWNVVGYGGTGVSFT